MSIRRATIPIVLAGIVSAIPLQAYAVNLSQILGSGEEQKLNTFKLIHVADLKALMATGGNKVHVFDANSDMTRERFGTIPGATLLASHDDYPLSVLPQSKRAKLVFYCADNH